MITIPPAAEESDAPQPIGPAAGKKPLPLVWIPATLCVGLLIAAVYLGGRIVTAHSQSMAHVQTKPAVTHAAPVVAPVVTKATPIVTPAPPVAPAEPLQAKAEPKSEPGPLKQVAAESIAMIAPHDGERYIQVGALDVERTRRYVGQLRDAKLEPHVAPGPTPEMLRVLIGPFADRESLASTRSQLDKAGIANFVREY